MKFNVSFSFQRLRSKSETVAEFAQNAEREEDPQPGCCKGAEGRQEDERDRKDGETLGPGARAGEGQEKLTRSLNQSYLLIDNSKLVLQKSLTVVSLSIFELYQISNAINLY